ncbi:ComEC/Rec2 family competence protein [Salinimicrobium marinum]
MVALLLVRPQFIFEVGFQLSYLAVFSFVLLQPIFLNSDTEKQIFMQ